MMAVGNKIQIFMNNYLYEDSEKSDQTNGPKNEAIYSYNLNIGKEVASTKFDSIPTFTKNESSIDL